MDALNAVLFIGATLVILGLLFEGGVWSSIVVKAVTAVPPGKLQTRDNV
jgi:hypothetical protein